MKNFEIIIKDELFLSDSNIIASIFYIIIEGKSFPIEDWNDYTSINLETWINILINKKNESNTNFKLFFMDGPYRIDIYKNDSMELFIKCVNFRNREIVEESGNCNYFDFLNELRKAAQKFIYMLYLNELHNERFKVLYEQLILLTNKIKQILKEDI